MTLITPVIVVVVLLLAFANGANDNSKGVATLNGGGTVSLRNAIRYSAVTTFLGSLAAVLLAGELISRFGGKGIVSVDLAGAVPFAAGVGLAAALTVLIASRLSLPISTTHSMVGAIVGIGLATGGRNGSNVFSKFMIPLLISPLIAVTGAAALYLILRRLRLRLGVGHQTCVCIEQEFHQVTVGGDGSLAFAASGLAVTKATAADCHQRYDGAIIGLNA